MPSLELCRCFLTENLLKYIFFDRFFCPIIYIYRKVKKSFFFLQKQLKKLPQFAVATLLQITIFSLEPGQYDKELFFLIRYNWYVLSVPGQENQFHRPTFFFIKIYYFFRFFLAIPFFVCYNPYCKWIKPQHVRNTVRLRDSILATVRPQAESDLYLFGEIIRWVPFQG